METKEVTISNIKFNLSTKPLVSEPETYPDYPSAPVNQITNKIITNLINYLPEYPCTNTSTIQTTNSTKTYQS